MVLIGQTVQAYEGLGCEHLVRFANLLGIESCEINPKGTSFKNIDKIIKALGKMKTTYHLPVAGIEGYDFAYPDKEKEIGDIIKLINKHSDDLHLILGVFHPVEERGNFETLVENLKQVNIKLVVENIQNYSDEEFENLYVQFKDELGDQLKGWLFDVAHSFLRNGLEDYMNLLDKMPFDELEEIHLSDCTKNEDSHYSFGAGIMPIENILQEIKRRKFNKIIVNEIDAYPSVWSTIDSYRKVAKYFKKPLYVKVSTRKLLIKPVIQRRLKKANIV
ncbi:MAG: sugar phosphate isomerase/epimerase [Candidatus Heimdallarchaeota archaeon]|nr:sugar phosphate isomerase/epimerase [Candidatus Heimdallarchaeota archaeon]MCK4878776.1 sugar phosphate isomerase/epimerase [Candidatus Heimdallarchaeota archaeon]